MTTILVAHASRHGSTSEVAENIAAVLRELDLAVEARACRDVKTLAGYDGVVLGAALYTGRVHVDARRFLKRHALALAAKPLAVFAMGPRTLDPTDIASSREQLDRALVRFPRLSPVAVAIFGGVIDPEKLRFPFHRMPACDARDWNAIRAWTLEVGTALAEGARSSAATAERA